MTSKEMVCIVCPIGCRLRVQQDADGEVHITGNRCTRGLRYGQDELLNPLRMVTSSIQVQNGDLPLVSVKTSEPISKEAIRSTLMLIRETQLTAPIQIGDVLIPGVDNGRADVIATRKISCED